MLNKDIWATISEFLPRGDYISLIKTCKETHWLSVDNTSRRTILDTYGVWRLPGGDYNGTNPSSINVHANVMHIAQWSGHGICTINYSMRLICYRLECVNDNNTITKNIYNTNSIMFTQVTGSVNCCSGNVERCPHASSKRVYVDLCKEGFTSYC